MITDRVGRHEILLSLTTSIKKLNSRNKSKQNQTKWSLFTVDHNYLYRTEIIVIFSQKKERRPVAESTTIFFKKNSPNSRSSFVLAVSFVFNYYYD